MKATSASEPLPGSVVLQFINCGKPRCRCQTGDKHGPYHYRIWREGKRVKKAYVPATQLGQVLMQCAQHQALADQLKRIVAERERLSQSLRLQTHWIQKEAAWGMAWDKQCGGGMDGEAGAIELLLADVEQEIGGAVGMVPE